MCRHVYFIKNKHIPKFQRATIIRNGVQHCPTHHQSTVQICPMESINPFISVNHVLMEVVPDEKKIISKNVKKKKVFKMCFRTQIIQKITSQILFFFFRFPVKNLELSNFFMSRFTPLYFFIKKNHLICDVIFWIIWALKHILNTFFFLTFFNFFYSSVTSYMGTWLTLMTGLMKSMSRGGANLDTFFWNFEGWGKFGHLFDYFNLFEIW